VRDPAGALARSRRVVCSCIALCLCEVSSFFFAPVLERSLHAPFIASRRYRVTRYWCVGDPCWRSSPEASGGLIRWRRGLYCSVMASVFLALLLHGQACVPPLREWFLSFGIVATCSVIPGPVAAWRICPCSLTRRIGPRPRGREMRCDLILIVGIVVQSSCSVL
jgi:hypothetical protein